MSEISSLLVMRVFASLRQAYAVYIPAHRQTQGRGWDGGAAAEDTMQTYFAGNAC